MVINLITFASILHKQASVRSSHEVILTELEKYFTVNFIDYKDIDKLSPDDFSIIFIATGGVERLVIQHFESLPRPAILLADGMQNSLAAALEISSWLRGRGMKSEILHGELPETIKRIFVLHSNFVAQRSLFGMRRLIDQTGTTGCLALALLNDEGIIAGCEGDLQSVFTMLAVKVLTGKNSFMANPSMINARTNEIILAHCTIGIAQTEQFIIRNHFETESGIGIQGILPTGDVTIVKCGSESLDEYYLSTGTLVENTNYINMCRTQVRIKMNSPADYFLKTPLGNHHIMLYGNYEDILEEFLQANACKRIE